MICGAATVAGASIASSNQSGSIASLS